MAERCAVCNGSKTYAPMGGIQVKCVNCEGVGYVGMDKSEQNRLKRQVIYPAANNSTITANQVIQNNVPITPIVADHIKDSVSVSANEIEAIKANMLAEQTKVTNVNINPANMDKRSKVYRSWKASQAE